MSKGLLLVTGATGLAGSNLCVAARQRGYGVRGLVRSASDTEPLTAAGVELVMGDVSDADSVARAVRGVQHVIHTAAVMGGTWGTATSDDHWAINYQGVVNVLDAAQNAGVGRCVVYSSTGVLDRRFTASNTSPFLPIGSSETPYSRAKRAAMYAGLHRAALGQDIVSVLPAQIYGPAPLVDRAVVPTSFTGTLLMALKGELKQYVPIPSSWVYVDDVVDVGLAALERGSIGERYLAVGREEDTCSLIDFCNLGCEIADVPHRVEAIDLSGGGDEIGAMRAYAAAAAADPFVDPSGTETALGIAPISLQTGLSKTIEWLREVGKL
jgi:dihydroflavonol-4-reductase